MTDTVIEAPNANPETRISFGASFAEQPPFLGRVTIDRIVPSDRTKSGRQWNYVVKPLEFETKGDGLPTYVNIPVANAQGAYSKRGGLYIAMESFRRVFFPLLKGDDLKALNVGEGQMLNLTGYFTRKDVKFGKNEQNEDIVATYILPVKTATELEIATAGQGVSMTPAAASAAPQGFSDEDLATMVEFVAGKTPVQYQKAAFKSDTLEQRLKDAIVRGVGIQAIVDAGLVQQDGDGMITRLAPE